MAHNIQRHQPLLYYRLVQAEQYIIFLRFPEIIPIRKGLECIRTLNKLKNKVMCLIFINIKLNRIPQSNKQDFNIWIRYPEQQVSIPMHLTIGQEYYMEALHKAGLGIDHLSVGVTLPSGKNEWPIPKKYVRFRPHQGKYHWSHFNTHHSILPKTFPYFFYVKL